eukprot:m.135610 g.135610  ORF g.135610 m.135610 type:complete len:603 (+) comp16564_c1_seq3:206-2014(+)
MMADVTEARLRAVEQETAALSSTFHQLQERVRRSHERVGKLMLFRLSETKLGSRTRLVDGSPATAAAAGVGRLQFVPGTTTPANDDLTERMRGVEISPSSSSRIHRFKYRGRTPERDLQSRIESTTENWFNSRASAVNARRGIETHFVFPHRQMSENDDDSSSDSNPDPHRFSEEVLLLLRQLQHGSLSEQQKAVVRIRKLLTIEHGPPIQEVIEAGVVPYLTQLLSKHDMPDAQAEAAWALTNIASGTSEQTMAVVHSGAVPLFIGLLHSPSADLRSQVCWALGNIAGDSSASRDLVLSCGGAPSLLKLYEEYSQDIFAVRNITWTMSNLCRGNPPPHVEMIRPIMVVLAKLLYSADPQILTDACWAFAFLSDGPPDRIQEVLNLTIAPRVIQLLKHDTISVVSAALRAMGNLVMGDDEQTQYLIEVGALAGLLPLIESDRPPHIIAEACWALSNISAGPLAHVQDIITGGIVPKLVGLADSSYHIVKEAVWVLCNIAHGGNNEHIAYIVAQNCFMLFSKVVDNGDAAIVSAMLNGLWNIIQAGERIKESRRPAVAANPFVEVLLASELMPATERISAELRQNESVAAVLEQLSAFFRNRR